MSVILLMVGRLEEDWLRCDSMLVLLSLLTDRSSSMNSWPVKHITSGQKCLRSAKNTDSTHKMILCVMERSVPVPHQVLCQFDTDGRGWIRKNSLRGLLFTYALPLSPDEFDQLWSR